MIFCFLFLAFVEAQRHLSVLNKAVDRCYHSAPAPCPVLCLVLQRPGLKVTCPHFLSSHVLVGSATLLPESAGPGAGLVGQKLFKLIKAS